MKTFILKSTAVVCMLLMVFTAASCKKDKTCHGKVHVVDTAGLPVNNAVVKLAAPSVQGDVVYDGTTDESGDVSFEVKLPAIFDVTATKATYVGMAGVGVLRLDEPGKTAEVDVTIQ
ncbi:MAG: carboxypeptidase-like regulatory domain-containing protein [Bacteroidota bacterium]|nr:carboxypeptidase-like regulatory domain-containing protein [Bacteroidota bacterium]